MSCYWVRLGGTIPATEIAPHTPPTWETLADGGTGDISFAFSLSPRSQHPLLRAGVMVEVLYGPTAVASGVMTEPDRTTWEVKAQGYATAAQAILALDGSNVPTRDVATALAVARSNGWWDVEDPDALTGTLAGDGDGPVYLGNLLTGVATQNGQRWGVDGRRRLFMRSDPTTPSLTIAPEVAAFGITDDEQATVLVGWYASAGGPDSRLRTAPGTTRVKQEMLDLRERGEMTAGEVDAYLDGLFTLGVAQPRWTNGVELAAEQITRSGVPAWLPGITAGSMVRATGMPVDFVQGTSWVDVVIGKTRYTAGARTIYLEPVGVVPRVLADVSAAS